MKTFKTTNRERYATAIRHIMSHPEKYKIIAYGKDYSAVLKNKATGCGWYVDYLLVI